MEPERWQKIKDSFQEALERSPEERRAYLDEACGSDGAQRQEIERLLANHPQADRFLDKLETIKSQSLKDPQLGSLEGRALGAYKILSLIGRGGMGDVYLAERSDEQYRQQVAVKLIKLGMESELLLDLFRQERQILANLDHPSIARLLDGGTFDGGRPYLVMEHIEGEPIDRYCETRQLSLRQRLELFRKVCDAVQYAHRNLVIHRDLKPSNILVTADGVPKLLDFGTAKLIETSEGEAPATRTGSRLLTPGYASPEQLKGEAITTGSDVYALGVVLYELLTGQRPFRFQKPLSPEVVRVVCEEEPPRPSTVVELPAGETEMDEGSGQRVVADPLEKNWRRRLVGDLDNILLMALRKEPSRRYATVEQLSEDLRRHLESLPVLARADTAVYRTAKFVRRHPAGVTAAALVFLLLVGAVMAITSQARRAQREGVRAQEVTDFLVHLLEASDPAQSQGKDVSVRDLLDKGAERVRGLNDQKDLQAMLLDTMGFVYYRLGAFDQASELLEHALEIHRNLGVQGPELAEVLDNLGQVLMVRGDTKRAEELLHGALDLRRELLGPRHLDLAETLTNLGVYYHGRGDFESARKWQEEALDMRRALLPSETSEVAASLNNLGAALRGLEQMQEAERLLREALDLHRRLFDEPHPEYVNNLNNLGAVRLALDDLEEAEALFLEARDMGRRLYRGQDHREVANVLHNLATALIDQQRFVEAEDPLREALAMRRRLLGPSHREVAVTLKSLGALFAQQPPYEQAVEYYRQACPLLVSVGTSEEIRSCLRPLGWVLFNQGDFRAAAQEFGRLIPYDRASAPSGDLLALARSLLGLGGSLRRTDEPYGCEQPLQEAMEIRRQELPAGHPDIGSMLRSK